MPSVNLSLNGSMLAIYLFVAITSSLINEVLYTIKGQTLCKRAIILLVTHAL